MLPSSDPSLTQEQPPDRPDPYRDGIWVRCPCCDDYWCRRHFMHAYDCACPPIEEWNSGLDSPRLAQGLARDATH